MTTKVKDKNVPVKREISSKFRARKKQLLDLLSLQ